MSPLWGLSPALCGLGLMDPPPSFGWRENEIKKPGGSQAGAQEHWASREGLSLDNPRVRLAVAGDGLREGRRPVALSLSFPLPVPRGSRWYRESGLGLMCLTDVWQRVLCHRSCLLFVALILTTPLGGRFCYSLFM